MAHREPGTLFLKKYFCETFKETLKVDFQLLEDILYTSNIWISSSCSNVKRKLRKFEELW